MRCRGPLVCALVAATARAADWPEKYLGAKGDQYNDDCRICEHKKYPQCEQGIWLNGTGCPPVYDKAGEVTTLSNVDEDGEPEALRKNDEEVLVDNAAAFCASDCKYILIDDEVLEVTSTEGDLLTVKRGMDGTLKAYHVAGSDIYLLHSLTKTNGTSWTSTKELFEMKEYRNFPWRWSGAVGVWEMDETWLQNEYPDWHDRKEAKGCFEERCCAEKKGACLELNVNAIVSVCLAFVLFCVCLLWCCCRFVPGCPKYNRRAERRADKMEEEA
jgi:hypothetical protein